MSTVNIVLIAVATVIVSYLLGSVSFAVIISNYIAHKDIRNMGSGNAGMTNMIRLFGAKAGLITFLLDSLKGFLVGILAKNIVFSYLFEQTSNAYLSPVYWGYICGIFCLLGHMFPVYFKFRGGKGVSSCAGIMLACNPLVFAIGLSVFLIVFIISRIVSLSSLFAAITIVVSTVFLFEKTGLPKTGTVQTVLVLVMALVISLRHKDNITRIANGEEKPLEVHREEK